MPKISVLIPVYNTERYLRQCLDSVVNQTLTDIEIICINDGSRDKSRNIIAEYESRDKRVKVIDKMNSGYGDSLNKGMELSKGEYIAIVESDDFIDSGMLATLYEKASCNNLDIVKSNYYEYRTEGGDILRELATAAPYGEVYAPPTYPDTFTGEIYLWTSLYKKCFIDANDIRFNITPGASYQDVSFTFKALACAERVMSVDEAFYHYRQDNPNSSVKSKEKVYCICDEFDEIERFCNKRPDIWDKMRKIIPYMMFKRYMGTYGRIDKKFKAVFLVRLKHDLEKFSEDDINRDIWSHEDWGVYLHLGEKCVDDYVKEQFSYFLEFAMLSYLENRKIYIYGAGQVGQRVKRWLDRKRLEAECFLVTSGVKSETDDLSVRVYSDMKDAIDEHDCIIIAVSDKLQEEIVTYLLQQRQNNILIMNREMRALLGIP